MTSAQGQMFLRQCCRTPVSRISKDGSNKWLKLNQIHSYRAFQASSASRMESLRSDWVTISPFRSATTRSLSDVKTQPLTKQETPPPPPPESVQEVEENILEGFEGTPGQALLQLNLKRDTVHSAEFVNLCHTVRAGYPRDATVIQFALQQYRRARDLVVDKPEASLAMEVMMKAKLSQNGENKVDAALFVLQTFRDTSTGLYYAAPMNAVDQVLEVLLEGVQQDALPRLEADDEGAAEQASPHAKEGDIVRKRDIRKRFRKLGIMPAASTPKKEKKEPPEDDSGQYQASLVKETTLGVVELLCLRKERPYRLMKKRAARAYKRQIRIHHGPTPTTIQTCSAIVLQLCGPTVAMEQVIEPCLKARCPVPPELIEELTTTIEQEQSVTEDEESSKDDDGQGDGEEDSEEEPPEAVQEESKQDQEK